MHELSLLENVRDIIEQQAAQYGFKSVKKIVLEIGALSCVEQTALMFAFDVVMQDSIATTAELSMIEVQGLAQCTQCQQQTAVQTLYEPCAFCGSFALNIVRGQELRIKELIVTEE